MDWALAGFLPPEIRDDHEARVLQAIEREGCKVMLVHDDADANPPLPPFAYSIGLFARFLHPEVIVYGLRDELMHSMINGVRDLARDGRILRAGERVAELIEGFEVEARTVHPSHYFEHFGWDTWFYDSFDFPVLQLVWPTTKGAWPWEPNAPQAILDRQPMLDQPAPE